MRDGTFSLRWSCVLFFVMTSGFSLFLSGCSSHGGHEYYPIAQEFPAGNISLGGADTISWAHGRKMAVMMSRNTKLSVESQESVVKTKERMADSIFFNSDFQLAQKEANDPRFEVGYVASVLQRSFGQLNLVDSVGEFDGQRFDGLVIIDIYRKVDNGFFSFKETFVLNTAFFDSQLRHVNTVSAEVIEDIPHAGPGGGHTDSYTVRRRALVKKALSTWQERLSQSIEYR